MVRASHATLLCCLSLLSMVGAADRPPPGSFFQSLGELVTRHGFATGTWLADCRQHDGPLPESLSKPLVRVVETLRRERQAVNLRRLHDYRRQRRIPTFAAAEKALAAAEKQVAELKRTACLGPAEAFARTLVEADDRLEAARDLTDRHWPDDLPVRVGIGPGTFGRYGWRSEFAGLVWDLEGWNRLAGPSTTIEFTPPGATLAERRPPQVNWVSAQHDMKLSLDGETVDWRVTESALVPAVLVETQATALRVCRRDTEGHGPDRVLVPVRDTALSVRRVPGRELPVPEDNWLLLAWEKLPQSPPLLVVFSQRPSRFDWSAEGLVAHFDGPAGKVVLGSYSGTDAWVPQVSMSWQAVSRTLLKRCRALVAAYACFPVEMEELFSVDEPRGEVEVSCRPTYIRLECEGSLPKLPATPLPPMLAALGQSTFPVRLPQLAQDAVFSTRGGPYRVSTGPSASYRLPICRYDHSVAPFPSASPSVPLALPDLIGFDDLCRLLAVWPGLSQGDRGRLGARAREQLAGQLEVVESGQAHAVEPCSLTLYSDLVADARDCGSAATIRQAGLLIDATYRYAKMTGDWDFVRAHWVALQDLLATQTAMTDWALMSPLPHGSPSAYVLPDALRGAVAMSQMAEAVEEAESLRFARYLTARLTVPYVAGFALERTAPETIMMESRSPAAWGGVPFPLAARRFAGVPMFPELVDLAAVHCDLASRQWLRTGFPKAFPDWATQGDAVAAGEYCLISATLGLPLDPAVNDAVRERLGTGSALARQLVGCANPPPPLRLAEWQPAALGACVVDEARKTVRIELTGAACLRMVSQFAPSEIRDNGQALPKGAWGHSFERARLVLPLEEGRHELEIVYGDAAQPKAGETAP